MDYLRVTFTPDLPLRWICVKAFRGIVYEVQSVVGKPIHVDAPVPKPTQEQIDELHARYVAGLQEIYDDWKENFFRERSRVLDRQGERSKEVLRQGSFHMEKIESMVIN
eukprot:s3536_g3.t1